MCKYKKLSYVIAVICALTMLFGCTAQQSDLNNANSCISDALTSVADLLTEQASGYNGAPYSEINGNVPQFSADEITTVSFEHYAELDSLGRCGTATACIGRDIMPTEERGSIGQVKPSGWQLAKYDVVDGKYLYNRCHLIGYQLTGENANVRNLITGTRYLNVTGMLPFENSVADYVRETDNHVMYRVTPVFDGDNLVADGVQMEAYSVEDGGEGISFNVYCYNVQPAVVIDYATGESYLSGETPSSQASAESAPITFVINKGTKKFHTPDCGSAKDIKPQNKKNYSGDRESLIESGYSPCSRCNP